MANYIFELKDKVRDYECDLQGIVNNANYQHYLEHCRQIKKEGVRYIFMQDIFRLPDMKLCIRAQVDSVCLVNGTLAESPELNEKFAPFMQ